MVKKRWICLFVENEIGVLARIAGLFASKSYNLDSLTVGETQDKTISRMTISLTSDDMTFEQVKKQLNRAVEVIKVVDYTDIPIYMRELLFVKIFHCSDVDKTEIFRIADIYRLSVADYAKDTILLECIQTEEKNNDLITLLNSCFNNRLEVVRGGSVAVESASKFANK